MDADAEVDPFHGDDVDFQVGCGGHQVQRHVGDL